MREIVSGFALEAVVVACPGALFGDGDRINPSFPDADNAPDTARKAKASE